MDGAGCVLLDQLTQQPPPSIKVFSVKCGDKKESLYIWNGAETTLLLNEEDIPGKQASLRHNFVLALPERQQIPALIIRLADGLSQVSRSSLQVLLGSQDEVGV